MPYTYRLTIAYDGKPFCGWQKQANGKTVQGQLEAALAKFLAPQRVKTVGACRTDSGVHAYNQVVMFKSKTKVAADFLKRLNCMLSPHISINSCQLVDDGFHPVRDARGKIYLYRVIQGFNPFYAPYAWRVLHSLDLGKMRAAANLLLGEQDFTSFCASDSSAKTRVRRLHEIVIESQSGQLSFWFNGSGFLKQMVRTMVGTLVMIGSGKDLAIDKILAERNRCLAGVTAPAQGLTLVQVYYDKHLTINDVRSSYTKCPPVSERLYTRTCQKACSHWFESGLNFSRELRRQTADQSRWKKSVV